MTQWDSIKMAQHFLRQANALNPAQARDEGRFEEELARQELLDECYMTSFSKPKLVEMLRRSVSGVVKFPEDLAEGVNLDEERYRNAYIKHARQVLAEIEK